MSLSDVQLAHQLDAEDDLQRWACAFCKVLKAPDADDTSAQSSAVFGSAPPLIGASNGAAACERGHEQRREQLASDSAAELLLQLHEDVVDAVLQWHPALLQSSSLNMQLAALPAALAGAAARLHLQQASGRMRLHVCRHASPSLALPHLPAASALLLEGGEPRVPFACAHRHVEGVQQHLLSEARSQLSALELHDLPMTAAMSGIVAAAPCMRELQRLAIQRCKPSAPLHSMGPDSLPLPASLTRLELVHSGLPNLPPLRRCSHLKHLDLAGNQLHIADMCPATQLTYLSLRGNPLHYVRFGEAPMAALQHLDLWQQADGQSHLLIEPEVATVLQRCRWLTYLACNCTVNEEETPGELASALQALPLRHLEVSFNIDGDTLPFVVDSWQQLRYFSWHPRPHPLFGGLAEPVAVPGISCPATLQSVTLDGALSHASRWALPLACIHARIRVWRQCACRPDLACARGSSQGAQDARLLQGAAWMAACMPFAVGPCCSMQGHSRARRSSRSCPSGMSMRRARRWRC